MTSRRVVITGMGGITALGSSWAEIKPGAFSSQKCGQVHARVREI